MTQKKTIKPKPREFWMNVYGNSSGCCHKTRKKALAQKSYREAETIKVREVMK